MTGAQLEEAGVGHDDTGSIYVVFRLDDEGKDIFGTYTTENVGGLIRIVLDKRLISAPIIDEPITAGDVSIRRTGGSFSIDEANQLAVQLRYGSLPIPLRVAESTAVGPTLGEDSTPTPYPSAPPHFRMLCSARGRDFRWQFWAYNGKQRDRHGLNRRCRSSQSAD